MDFKCSRPPINIDKVKFILKNIEYNEIGIVECTDDFIEGLLEALEQQSEKIKYLENHIQDMMC